MMFPEPLWGFSSNISSSVMSRHSHLSPFATASHAMSARTCFSVTYKPRSCQSAFIDSVKKYLEAQNTQVYARMRFMMRLEDQEASEERLGGTIVFVGDNASSKWPESELGSLKVQ